MAKQEYYKWLIIREFYYNQFLSSAELTERIGKSLPIVTKMINELVQEGLLVDSGLAPSSGGRRPATFSLKAGNLYILSVAMDQLITRIAVMDLHNNMVVAPERFELSLLQPSSEILLQLASKINEVISKSGIDPKNFIGTGVGMPGFIDVKKGVNYSFLNTNEKPIGQSLSEKIGMPVYIDNDSSLIALAEHKFGAARNRRNSMVINIGWGVGLGMILNGELFRGNNGFAGEFSHIPLYTNNKLCSCGKFGCLETETSLKTVIEKAALGIEQGRASLLGKNFPIGHPEQDWESIVTAASRGDQFVIEILSEAAYQIGRGISILIHVMNPELVVLSGRGALAGKVWQAPIQQALNEHCIPRLSFNTEIDISTLGYNAELIGSAALVMESQLREHSKNNNQSNFKSLSETYN